MPLYARSVVERVVSDKVSSGVPASVGGATDWA